MNTESNENQPKDAEEWKAPEQGASAQSSEISESHKEVIAEELKGVEIFLGRLDEEDEATAYADTGGPMETIDAILGGIPEYEALKPMRQEAARLGMSQDPDERQEGIKKTREWVAEVKKIIE